MAESFAFDQNQRRGFDNWLTSNNADEVTPDALYKVLGVAPGTGPFKSREELQPGFLDKFLDAFGVQTDKVKELKTLSLKQKQLEPFVNEMLKLKAVDLIHRNAQLRAAPESAGESPAADATLGFGGGPAGSLQPAPPLGGDPAMQGMPLGASSAQAAAMPQITPTDNTMPHPLSDGGRFMTPDAAVTTPFPTSPQAPQFDYQGRPIAPTPQPEMIPQPIRPEPIASPMANAPTAQAAPRKLKDFERFQAAQLLNAQAQGHLVPDENGVLRPVSMVAGENKMLKAPDIQAAAQLYGVDGLQVAPGTRLPAGTVQNAFAQRLKTTHENAPEIVKLQKEADKLPAGSERRAELESRIDRLRTNGTANIGEVAAAQSKFAALPPYLQTSQNAAAIARQHKDVLTEDVLKGIKNPNQPLVNVNTGVTASEEAAKEFMKSTRATFDQLKGAPIALQNIEEAKKLIAGASGFMGPGGESLLGAAKFLNNRLGTKIDTAGIKDAEELRSRIFFNIMDSLKKMDAQPSELQQRVMMDSLGRLGTDPNALGNVLDAFADTIRGKVEQHNAEVQSAESRGTKFPYNPVIKLPTRKAAGSQPGQPAPARVESDEDYNKLPSGTLFISPDGKTRRKP